MTTVHTSREFEAELEELRARALDMGVRCEQVTGAAFRAFWQGKAALAAGVSQVEAQLDQDEVDIQGLALRVIALRQPVADDLRFLAAAMRLVTDLERVGDEATNIAECVIEGREGAKTVASDELREMDREVQDMLHAALRAFVERDANAAKSVLLRDDAVDRHCENVIGKMENYIASHTDDVDAGVHVMWVAKYLERIADHAINVAEEVIFMIRGEDVRHGTALSPTEVG
jgi:phosphate transport system protein